MFALTRSVTWDVAIPNIRVRSRVRMCKFAQDFLCGILWCPTKPRTVDQSTHGGYGQSTTDEPPAAVSPLWSSECVVVAKRRSPEHTRNEGETESRCLGSISWKSSVNSAAEFPRRDIRTEVRDDPTCRILYSAEMDLFNLIKAPNPTKVKTGTRQRTAHEVPLLTDVASRVIQMVDATELSTSSGTPSIGVDAGVHGPAAAEQEIPMTDDAGATEATVEPNLEKEVISMGNDHWKRHDESAGEEGSKAPAKVLWKDHDAARVKHNAREGK
ncbi:hypothetical protein Tco_0819349 [Tanacetum coccineum]|uniref:Uncharacterized protein n=1 Tax=Tanacetum coccineum TaxID=301880 RepID=A0ABQ5A6A4_9ASTR